MDFGILLTFSNPQYRSPVTHLVESQLAQAVLAEELSYDHVWTAGHHGTDMYFPSQFPVLGAIAARTRRIRLGTYIVALPLNSPLDLAEQAATLDVISGGRFEFGLGAGIFTHDFEAHGVSRGERGSRMEEGLTIIKGLWENETFSFEGKHHKLPPFRLTPRPVQAKAPLWVAAATGTVAFDRAARFGAHLAGTSGGLDYYNERLRHYGRDPKDFNRAVLHFTHVAETREQAWHEAAPAILSWLEYYKKQFDSHDQLAAVRKKPGSYFGVDPLPQPDDLENVQRLHFLGSPFVVGDADDAAGWVDKAMKGGATHIVMSMQFGSMSPELSERSIRVFAKDVIPRYR